LPPAPIRAMARELLVLRREISVFLRKFVSFKNLTAEV
jgi:hypothetical protein